jgi:hypothetical protein
MAELRLIARIKKAGWGQGKEVHYTHNYALIIEFNNDHSDAFENFLHRTLGICIDDGFKYDIARPEGVGIISPILNRLKDLIPDILRIPDSHRYIKGYFFENKLGRRIETIWEAPEITEEDKEILHGMGIKGRHKKK